MTTLKQVAKEDLEESGIYFAIDREYPMAQFSGKVTGNRLCFYDVRDQVYKSMILAAIDTRFKFFGPIELEQTTSTKGE